MRNLYLIRHGSTEANEKWLYCGATDIPLSVNGRAELKRKKRYDDYPDMKDARIYTSGLLRTEETLNILFGTLPHYAFREFAETNFGVFEMKSYESLKENDVYQKWISGDYDENIAPGGESSNMMRDRVIKKLNELLEEDGDILIVCHGGPIVAIMQYFFAERNLNRYEWQPKGGEGYHIILDGTEPVSYSPIPVIHEKSPIF
ncbi:MAG: histidine phosphatase family protein [Eubacterium sp.]|nr:histidine phosphatase family protein [Eubacterium sp.]